MSQKYPKVELQVAKLISTIADDRIESLPSLINYYLKQKINQLTATKATDRTYLNLQETCFLEIANAI